MTAPTTRAVPASGPAASVAWRHVAADNLVLADLAARIRGANPMVWSNLTRASARVNGWSSPTTRRYLGKVMASRLPSGGWGLDEAADAFGDGTVNPASTTYTVTTAEHVGGMLVEGYRAGVVARSDVDRAVGALMALPRVETPRAACLDYSSSPHDRATFASRCVHNANAAAGLFLRQAAELGVERPGQRALAAKILAYDASQQRPDGMWPYMTGVRTPQDLDHNSLNAAVHLEVGETRPDQAGGRALAATYAHGVGADPLDALALVALVPYAPQQCSRTLPVAVGFSRRVPSLTPHPLYDHAYLRAVRYSQVALSAARNAEACPAPQPRRRVGA